MTFCEGGDLSTVIEKRRSSQFTCFTGTKVQILTQKALQLCIVMAFCEGGDLSTVIEKRKMRLFPEQEVISWFLQISLALQVGVCVIHTHTHTHTHTRTHTHTSGYATSNPHCVSICTSLPVKQVTTPPQQLLRQTLYFCTSKAGKLSLQYLLRGV